MKVTENECVGCTDLGLPCLGSSCSNRNVVRYYCDECGSEETLYNYEGYELCELCIIKKYKVIAETERI